MTTNTPATGFDNLGLHETLLRAIRDMGYTQPTAVQADAIPAAAQGRDTLACAATGSGKTAAFLLPIIEQLRTKPRGTTRALVITPTRELAAQIEEQREQLAKHTGVTGAAVFGGVGMGPQETAFRRGVDIIAATPGRLLDHLSRPYASLGSIEILVLDEADRMLDMGFMPDIKRILAQLPKQRQTMLFSATMPGPIRELSRSLLDRPIAINIERKQEPAKGIEQALWPVPSAAKMELLVEMLRRDVIGNVIVFCRTKHRANRLAQKLEKRGVSVARIHGNRSQSQRTDALAGFKSGEYRVLVATDIVARGIDVEALDHVLNFDLPNTPEEYIHRVGRTGRADLTGEAYTFVTPEDESEIRRIERQLGRTIERRKLDGFDYSIRADEPLEIPIADRIAEIRARKREERARAAANAERREQARQGGASAGGRERGGRGSETSRTGSSSGRTSSGVSRGPASSGAGAAPNGNGSGPATGRDGQRNDARRSDAGQGEQSRRRRRRGGRGRRGPGSGSGSGDQAAA